jgi:hypothetical protein
MDILERIKQSKTYNAIAILCVIFTFCTVIRIILIYFNLIPGYYVEWHKTDTIVPIVNLFPGQKIRFDLGFYDIVSEQDISSAKWEIMKAGKHFEVDGRTPTFVLPPTKGGIYQLHVVATTLDGKIRKGQANLYVVQDEPITIKLSTPTQVHLTAENTNQSLLKDIQSNGVEVYAGQDKWVKAQNINTVNNAVTFGLESNQSISAYEGQVLFRVQGSADKLKDYGSAHLPYAVTQPK